MVILLASDRNKMYLTKLEMVIFGRHGEKFCFVFPLHDFLKNHTEKTRSVCAHRQRDDGADMPSALDTVLIRPFLRVKTESLSESCLCYAAVPVYDFFFFHCKRSWIEGLS